MKATLILLFILPSLKSFCQANAKDSISVCDTIYSYFAVETKPEYPGGESELMKFIAKNIKFPQTDKDDYIGSKIYVSFIINKDGGIEDVRIIKSINEKASYNKAITNMVQSMPNWKPAIHKGNLVCVQYSLPITICLK